MANVQVHKEGGNKPAPVARQPIQWEPFRTMREMLRWDPFGEMTPAWPMLETPEFMPSFEVKETKEGYVFTADLPGVEEKNLEVKTTQNRLTISGKRESEKSEQGDTYYTSERSYGAFSRAFTLPNGADLEKVQAKLESGVLTVNVPKKPEAQPRKIAVSSK
jgi:HSP20 family protein